MDIGNSKIHPDLEKIEGMTPPDSPKGGPASHGHDGDGGCSQCESDSNTMMALNTMMLKAHLTRLHAQRSATHFEYHDVDGFIHKEVVDEDPQ